MANRILIDKTVNPCTLFFMSLQIVVIIGNQVIRSAQGAILFRTAFSTGLRRAIQTGVGLGTLTSIQALLKLSKFNEVDVETYTLKQCIKVLDANEQGMATHQRLKERVFEPCSEMLEGYHEAVEKNKRNLSITVAQEALEYVLGELMLQNIVAHEKAIQEAVFGSGFKTSGGNDLSSKKRRVFRRG